MKRILQVAIIILIVSCELNREKLCPIPKYKNQIQATSKYYLT